MADTDRARRRTLLAEIRRLGGHTTTGQAHRFYQATGHGPCRTTARKDLQYYVRRGVLAQRGPDNDRTYTLKDGAK
ncbi:hypothetical protein [Streptomyces scabiei]|uniref:hypothetical protein n=1 Tax=Streptomyces scabiei TaxID=1930 RepID=UPI0029AA4F2F|nr:hypothetical protein [Streptomyces scabiei]MDX3520773.1 hypothetical protein [Streptomyces scabiei]